MEFLLSIANQMGLIATTVYANMGFTGVDARVLVREYIIDYIHINNDKLILISYR